MSEIRQIIPRQVLYLHEPARPPATLQKSDEKNQDCSRTMFTNEELQQVLVPETWKWLPLGDVATILNGDRGKNYAGCSTWIDSGIPFANAGTLQNSVLTEEGMNYISKERILS